MPLFQLAANQMFKDLDKQESIQKSIKYQVLSKETAMVGVVKQKKKATGEMLEYTIEFGKKVTAEVDESDMIQQVSYGACRSYGGARGGRGGA